MSPESVSRLFQPFVQVDPTMHRQFGGTGLGLLISKRIAEALGGSLTVVSALDIGSKFAFRLPLAPSKSGSGILSPGREEPGGGAPLQQDCEPVLVLDDDCSSPIP